MLNDQDLVVLLLCTSCTLLASTIGFAAAWIRARERRLRERVEAPRPQDTALANTDRLELAVDAIALEIERISEGQRFVTRLLAERDDQSRQPAARIEPPRAITPH
jgi:hypothetical protein